MWTLEGARAGASVARLTRTAADRGLWLSHGDTALHVRLAAGAFPEVASLIPRAWGTRVTVGADAFAQKTATEARSYKYTASPLQEHIDRLIRILSALAICLSASYVVLYRLRGAALLAERAAA